MPDDPPCVVSTERRSSVALSEMDGRNMNQRLGLLPVLASLGLLWSAAAAAAPLKTEVKKLAIRRGTAVAPLPREKATRFHAPFESGQCGVCHQNNDPQKPGPIRHATVNDQCFECHDDVRDIMSRKYKHVAAKEACTNCHNPHNANQPALLAADGVEVCTSCHAGIRRQLAKGKVQHGAVNKDKKCANCHNPHASHVERLLIALPFDLCVSCHSKDGMKASDGTPMTNFKRYLDENKIWHDPIRAKDCSACHRTHAGDNYRLLTAAFPSAFYAEYDRKAYALCYSCHNDRVVSVKETTTLTGFRDGSKNLHFVHVNRERGRTCRACHEVHASKQEHHIRESVPYGPKGWMLKVGYTKLPTGGTCVKTCHDTRTYNNKSLTSSAPASR
jgi:predicted CXXCH cytochrome family protein